MSNTYIIDLGHYAIDVDFRLIGNNRLMWLRDVVRKKLISLDVAVEVGVGLGAFSYKIIEYLEPKQTFGVDPYYLYDDYKDKPSFMFESQEKLSDLYRAVRKKLENLKSNKHYKLIRDFSKNACTSFEDLSVDFVYIDGNHKYEYVKEDIELWWPKVKHGGIFAGHDYIEESPEAKFGVIQAVDQFVLENKLTLNLVKDEYPSWWVTKDKI